MLCRLEEGLGFPELMPRSILVADQGLTVRVIDLDMLIEVKRRAGRAKDLLTLPVLIALRDQLSSGASDD